MLKIYGVPISVHTRKAIVTAIAKNLPHEVVPVVPVVPGNPPPNWRELSPSGMIPALTDGDFTVADSGAICAYLERLQPNPPLFPAEPKAQARAVALQAYATEVLFREVVRVLFHEVFVHPKIRNIPTSQAAIDTVLNSTLPEVFGYLDAEVKGDFLLGDTMSIADIAVISNLITLQYIGFDIGRERFPRLAALFDRVVAHPAMRETLRREEAVVDSMGLKRGFLEAVAA